MAKFCMFATSDKAKKGKTISGNRYIDISLGYGENDYSKLISIRINRPDNTGKVTLWVDGDQIKEID